MRLHKAACVALAVHSSMCVYCRFLVEMAEGQL